MVGILTALADTSTDTLVSVLGDLRHSLGQALRDSARAEVIDRRDTLLALDYIEAAAEVTELLDARLARG
jgi:hypothetical protein